VRHAVAPVEEVEPELAVAVSGLPQEVRAEHGEPDRWLAGAFGEGLGRAADPAVDGD